jgi:hypothetical protein
MPDDTNNSQQQGQPQEQKPLEPKPAETQNSGSNLPDPNPQRLDEAQRPNDFEKRSK